MSARTLKVCGGLLVIAASVGVGPFDDNAAELSGTYKLVVLPPMQDAEFLLIEFKKGDEKPQAEVKASLQGDPKAAKIVLAERKGQKVRVVVNMQNADQTFRGSVGKDEKVRGTFRLGGRSYPAELVKTTSKALGRTAMDRTVMQKVNNALRASDPKDKVAQLKDLLETHGKSAKADILYANLIQAAAGAKLSSDEVNEIAQRWQQVATAYGQEHLSGVQAQIVKALKKSPDYASMAEIIDKSQIELALNVALEEDKELGTNASKSERARAASVLALAAERAGKTELAAETKKRAGELNFAAAEEAEKKLPAGATADMRARAAGALLAAAKKAGKNDVAADAEKRLAKLDKELDEEYHKTVPPFKPETSFSRKNKDGDRVVLMELFTGAQCPPCVAADVAFDALGETYKPAELILLQYHLHIPGPDPLTNDDTMARQQYYSNEVRGTPSTMFNGKDQAGGGGGMAGAKGKYDDYRKIIDEALDQKKQAQIDLDVKRDGDTIQINATAKADKPGEKLKLRLALVEEQVKYPGGNRLRFHHHVVRALPGGAAGVDLKDGEGKSAATIKLSELRGALETYLSGFVRDNGDFPNPLPEIPLKNLRVVAFVQDDANKSVLHAVQAEVAEK